MAIALDTNILIYAHFPKYPEHEKARSFLEQLLKNPDPFYLGWQVCYEYIRLVTHPRVLKSPLTASQAGEDLHPYLTDPRGHLLVETENHYSVLRQIIRSIPSAKGNFIHDCHYAALLKEHGIQKIATADADFLKFGFLEVINPCVVT